MTLLRLALVVTFYAGLYVLMFFGGDYVELATESRWLAAAIGLISGALFLAMFFGAEKLVASKAGRAAVSDDEEPELEDQPVGATGIIVLLSLAALVLLASFERAGTPLAFGGGMLIGCLVVLTAKRSRAEKTSLQS